MKVKELLKTVNVAWSPPAQYPILLAAGTAAQQLDASFNTSASLDLYSLNLQQPGYDLELKASVASDHRFHKIIWGSYGSNPAGMIVGGCDQGKIKIYCADKLLSNDPNCLISSPDRHTGPVRTMDFNPFQSNLLASGATESEIYIWDIVNTSTPMAPGSKSQPLEDVQHIAWNKQVQHILASTFTQRCVIWDLRKNEPIIKLTDANSKVRWKVVQWHPDVATQLCLASEEDQAPTIELWDLRFATSPLKTLQNHQRGVLSIAWNTHDSDLLLSCAKDNRILCWNPNSDAPNGEVICELAQTNQWNFDVSWCPRHPGLVVGSSFDGHAVVYSLLGGQTQMSTETSNKIVDSFPGMDPFTQPKPVVQTESAALLSKAPKWLRRPFGGSFGFGGKLTIFENEASEPSMPGNISKKVIISQVITQPDLIQRSNELENALRTEQFGDYCRGKIENAVDDHRKTVWSCVGAYFGDNVTNDVLQLLGYNTNAISEKLSNYTLQTDINTVTDGVANLDNGLGANIDKSAAFDAIVQEQNKKLPKPEDCNYKIITSDDEDGLITQAILMGNIEAAVALCFQSKRYAEAIILSMAGGSDLLARTQYRYFSEHTGALNSLINSLVSENWIDVVQNCDLNCWKEILVGVFTHCNSQERASLCDVLGDRLTACDNSALKQQAQICYICSGNLNKMIEVSDVDIQETVELVMVMQKALAYQGNTDIRIEGKIANILSEYAEMLAAEGNLEAALNYLNDSNDERMSMLKHRLCQALGRVQSSLQTNTGILKNQNVANAYMPLQQPTNSPNWSTAPTKQPYGSFPNQYTVPPQPQPLNVLQPQIPLQPSSQNQYPLLNPYNQMPAQSAVPPPPPAASISAMSSRPPSVGPQSKSKYIIDPSVKSSSPYGQTTFSQPQSQLYGSQPTPPMPGFPTQSSFQKQATGLPSGYPNTRQNYMPEPKEPEPFKPLQPNTSSMPPPVNQMYDANRPQPQTPMYRNENSYQTPPQPSGWNDPPIAKSSRAQPVLALYNKNEMSAEHAGTRKWKAKHSKSNDIKNKVEYQHQAPILHPLLGAVPQSEPMVTSQQNFYSEPQIPYSQPQFNQNIPELHTEYVKPVQSSTEPIERAKVAESEILKAPIPEQHMHLKTVLDELRIQCFENAKNPQIKRKIDDVSRKLDVLYDSLRENKLSPSTLQGLHDISQLIQAGDYTNGLHRHAQLVSGPDFSQIASFMPGIKVLLQCALQLGVYIR